MQKPSEGCCRLSPINLPLLPDMNSWWTDCTLGVMILKHVYKKVHRAKRPIRLHGYLHPWKYKFILLSLSSGPDHCTHQRSTPILLVYSQLSWLLLSSLSTVDLLLNVMAVTLSLSSHSVLYTCGREDLSLPTWPDWTESLWWTYYYLTLQCRTSCNFISWNRTTNITCTKF